MRKLIIFLILIISSPAFPATFYVDKLNSDSSFSNEALNCSTPSDTDYNVTTRQCGEGSETVYSTIQAAVTATDGKDTVYVRNGTYSEIDIALPNDGGDAWTSGNYSLLSSYTGEWAIIDGTGLNTDGDEWNTAVIGNLSNYTPSSMSEATHYWIIERLEITGGRCGILMKPDPMKFRYLYVHDNTMTPDGVDTLHSGILVVNSQDSYYEYNNISDNEPDGTPGALGNNSGLLLDADYRDGSSGDGSSFDTDLGTQKNIIRYNYIYGHNTGIAHKNQQRFGVNSRDPDPVTGDMASYLEYGDKVHHNIIFGATNYSYGGNQDYQQVYNNITDKRMSLHSYHEFPMTYGYVVYNNTIKTAGGSSGGCYSSWSALDERVTNIGDYGTAWYNNYDTYEEETRTAAEAHPWIWMYNNICAGPTSSAQEAVSFMWLGDSPTDETPTTWDATNLVVDKNYINGVTNTDQWYVGNLSTGYTDGDCKYKWMTVDEFNACQDTWRSTSGTSNYDTSSDGLWVGGGDGGDYTTSGSHVITGAVTIANGGIGGNHPYIVGETLPSYIGATNPSDNDWVAGVLALDATYLKSVTIGSTPSWVEGEDDSTAPTCSGNITTSGQTLELSCSETVTFGAGGNGGIAITSSTQGENTATYVSGSGTSTLTYSLSKIIYSGETFSVETYTQPTDGIEDASGNDMLTDSDLEIVNNSTATAVGVTNKATGGTGGSALGGSGGSITGS